MKINELEVTCKSFKQLGNTMLSFTVEGDASEIIREVRSGAVVVNGNITYGGYTVFESALINKDGSVTVMLKKPETWREVIARLEEENAALRDELLDTQEALAELAESKLPEENSEESEEESGEEE